jgi:hypothetical protein
MRRRWTLPGFALVLLTACSQPEPPPYGFATFPEQRWRFETEETFDVDGSEAKSIRFADVILRAKVEPSGETEVELYLDRYYTRTQGTPTGESELSISEKGVSVQTAQSGRVGFGPNDKTLGGDTPLEMRARPIASAQLGPRGEVLAPIWQSPHPLLLDLALLDWLIFALPTRAPADAAAWVAQRTVPQTGQISLGIELPLRWERAPDTLRASGSVERASLRVADELEGRLVLDAIGTAQPLDDGRVLETLLELRMDFTGTGGEHVVSRHKIRARCTSCEAPVNSPATGSDSGREREGTAQQGYVDDLPDHGGVRRGL